MRIRYLAALVSCVFTQGVFVGQDGIVPSSTEQPAIPKPDEPSLTPANKEPTVVPVTVFAAKPTEQPAVKEVPNLGDENPVSESDSFEPPEFTDAKDSFVSISSISKSLTEVRTLLNSEPVEKNIVKADLLTIKNVLQELPEGQPRMRGPIKTEPGVGNAAQNVTEGYTDFNRLITLRELQQLFPIPKRYQVLPESIPKTPLKTRVKIKMRLRLKRQQLRTFKSVLRYLRQNKTQDEIKKLISDRQDIFLNQLQAIYEKHVAVFKKYTSAWDSSSLRKGSNFNRKMKEASETLEQILSNDLDSQEDE